MNDKIKKEDKSIETTGVVYGNVGVGTTTYETNKFHGRQGHGFAAERAEHVRDLYHGEEVKILGDDNAKNGADRLVNGVEIQSKYCRNGAACIQECFENGQYRYYSSNGEPMKIEVPADMYEDAVKAMRRRISNNEIEGVINPDEAVNLVKKGHYTYAQVKQIAQAGTIESLTFDAANGMIVAKDALGITALITFATSIWNGEDTEGALENAALSGLKVGGVSFLTTVLTSQIARTSVVATVRGGTDILVSKMGTKATEYLAKALKGGTDIYGAEAMNNVSKLLAGNIIASTVSLVILSAGDIVDLFRNRISGAQFVKNVTTTGATIAGGGAGWGFGNTGGAAIGGWVGGTIAGPAGAVKGAEVGAKMGGFTGSVIGGATAGTVTHSALDGMIEDDTVFMMRIAEQEFAAICEQYLLTENEVYLCLEMLKKRLDKKELKNIFSSSNRELYVQSIIMKCVDPVLKKREYIKEFDSEDVFWGMRMLIEDAVDGEGIFDKNAYAPSMAEVKENLLQNTNVKDEQINMIMQPVVRMNKTQMRVERTMRTIKRDNEETEDKMNEIQTERMGLKEELNKIMEEK